MYCLKAWLIHHNEAFYNVCETMPDHLAFGQAIGAYIALIIIVAIAGRFFDKP